MEDPSQKQSGPHPPEHSSEQPAEPVEPRSRPLYAGLPTGTGLGKYRILERLRTTHNAVIYKARDATLDRLVTVKQMSPALIDNPVACGQFRREAQFLARIPKDAKHVVNIHELIEDQSGLFIVEEYVTGHWLESLIAKRQDDPYTAIKLLKTAATGLRTLHLLDLMHRGVHPVNLIVGRNNNVKIANLTTAAHESDTTPPPTLVPKYSAPELLMEIYYDNRVDIYSLGFSIYEYCVGRSTLHKHFGSVLDSPATAIGFWARWHTDLKTRLPDACELNPLVPPGLSSILRRMTAKRLDDRYASMLEVLDELSPHLDELSDRPAPRQIVPFRSSPRLAPSPTWPGYMLEATEVGVRPPTYGPTIAAPAAAPGTSRRTVRQPVQTPRPYPAAREPEPVLTAAGSGEIPIPAPAAPERLRRKPTLRPPPHPVVPEAIPLAKEVVEIHKPRHPHFVARVLSTALLIVMAAAAGATLWRYYMRPRSVQPIERLVADGLTDYEQGAFAAARAKLREASESPADTARLIRARDRAIGWLSMVDAQIALTHNDFDLTLHHIRDAQKRGVNPSAVTELQQRCWTKKDVYRLEEEGRKALQEGHLAEAEMALDEYKQKAMDAGVNGSKLESQIQESRADQRYAEAINRAHIAVDKGEWDEASLAVTDAERIRITSDTRRLSQRVSEGKERADLILRGDNAMLEKDYADAASSYERANQIETSAETEQKARMASAHILYGKAEEALDKGDLLAAERYLSSSMWKHPTPQAQTRLKKLGPAFEAAREIQTADQEMAQGNCAEAVRRFEEAIPKLPKPISEIAKERLLLARQCAAVRRGDEACQRNDWAAALEAYEEARSLGRNGDILKKIEMVKAKMLP